MTLDPYVADGLVGSVARLAQRRYSSVLHLGAGRGTDLSIYRWLQADVLVLVGVDEPPAPGLDARARPSQRVQFIDACVSADGTAHDWHRYNVPRFDGLVNAQALSEHYPRLELIGVAQRETRRLSDVVSGLPPCSEPGDRLLVIDLPGQATHLIRSLSDEAMRGFGVIVARQCPLLGDGVDELRRAAPRHRHVTTDELTDPLFPAAVLLLDPSALERDVLARRVSALEHEHRALQESLEQTVAQAERAKAAEEAAQAVLRDTRSMFSDAQAQVDALRAASAAAVGQSTQSAEALAAERRQWQAERQAFEAERDRLQALAAQTARDSDAAVAERNQARAEVEALTRRLAESDEARSQEKRQWHGERQALESERDQARAAIETLNRRVTELAETIDLERTRSETERNALLAQVGSLTAAAEEGAAQRVDLAQRLESALTALRNAEQVTEELRQASRKEVVDWQTRAEWLERELNQARQGQLLASKLQVMRENDLRDLQERYRELALRQQSQRELLAKLAQRLTLAQEYFQQLPNLRGESSG